MGSKKISHPPCLSTEISVWSSVLGLDFKGMMCLNPSRWTIGSLSLLANSYPWLWALRCEAWLFSLLIEIRGISSNEVCLFSSPQHASVMSEHPDCGKGIVQTLVSKCNAFYLYSLFNIYKAFIGNTSLVQDGKAVVQVFPPFWRWSELIPERFRNFAKVAISQWAYCGKM